MSIMKHLGSTKNLIISSITKFIDIGELNTSQKKDLSKIGERFPLVLTL